MYLYNKEEMEEDSSSLEVDGAAPALYSATILRVVELVLGVPDQSPRVPPGGRRLGLQLSLNESFSNDLEDRFLGRSRWCFMLFLGKTTGLQKVGSS